jgi:hypothetical protein
METQNVTNKKKKFKIKPREGINESQTNFVEFNPSVDNQTPN